MKKVLQLHYLAAAAVLTILVAFLSEYPLVAVALAALLPVLLVCYAAKKGTATTGEMKEGDDLFLRRAESYFSRAPHTMGALMATCLSVAVFVPTVYFATLSLRAADAPPQNAGHTQALQGEVARLVQATGQLARSVQLLETMQARQLAATATIRLEGAEVPTSSTVPRD